MKRGNDKGQLSKEEFEALSDEDNEAGTFKRASDNELAKRRIVKSKRPSTGNTSLGTLGTFPSASTSKESTQSNPFASFSGLTPNVQTTANPFSGFSGLVTTTNPSNNHTTSTAQPVNNLFTSTASNTGSTTSFSTNDNKSELSEREQKISKLNNAFLKWADKHIKTKPLSIWKDGAKDYIRHMATIDQRYPSKDSVNEISDVEAPASNGNIATFGVSNTEKNSTSSNNASAIPSFSFNGGQLKIASASSAVTSTSLVDEKKEKSTTSAPFQFTFPSTTGGNNNSSTVAGASNSTLTGFGGFSFPSTSSTAQPSATFSFTAAPSSSSGSVMFPAPTNNNTSFASKSFSFGGSSDTTATATDNNDDEGEPLLEPEKVHKNDQDTDEILHEVPCKLFGFNKESKEWRDTGKGTLRVTRAQGSTKQRMLIRNPIGKIIFNAAFYKGMKIDVTKKRNGLQFSAIVAVEDVKTGEPVSGQTELKGFMIRLNPTLVDSTLAKLEAGIAALS